MSLGYPVAPLLVWIRNVFYSLYLFKRPQSRLYSHLHFFFNFATFACVFIFLGVYKVNIFVYKSSFSYS